MARLVLCVLALCAGAFAVPVTYETLDTKVIQERQLEILLLLSHIHEPTNVPKCQEAAKLWKIEENLQHYENVTAAKTLVTILKNGWNLPRAALLSLQESSHVFEVTTVFHVLYSAKDYKTFYNTAAYLRDILNEEVYLYVLTVTVLYRHDTQGITLPPIYEILPSYFNNAEILATAQRINTHGHHLVKNYPSTYIWDDNVVIKWNDTLWPYHNKDQIMSYYTHDYSLNAVYSTHNLLYPQWLGSDVVPGLVNDRRGEMWWFRHKQLVARYYMERLSNCLGEIPEISSVVEDGYESGLVYPNGVPFPTRPNHYSLDQPHLVEHVQNAIEYERRVWDSIDKGFVVNEKGENVNILTEEGLDILGSVVQSNADSVNGWYYKNFLGIWQTILGNTVHHHYQYHNHYIPLVLPSVLENYMTAPRDPAYYMIWKRVLSLFSHWQKRMPKHKYTDLKYPEVSITKVDVDKLVTYFEHSYMNITQYLHQSVNERAAQHEDTSVLVQHPILNHKQFNIRVHVKSEVAKTVVVKFFLAPKYDSKNYEIPLHENTDNFVLLDHFLYDVTAGESVITRESINNAYTFKKWPSAMDIFDKSVKGQWQPDMSFVAMDKIPHHLLLPKGKVDGMPFQLVVYIQEYKAPKVPYGTGFNPKTSLGLGTGARFLTDQPLAFPLDRPLYSWQVQGVRNMWFQDVLIYHKHTPEVFVPHTE